MSSDVSTRPMRAEDYDAVIRLWQAAKGVEVGECDDRATIVGYLQRNPGLSRVAEAGETLVGAVLCGHDGRRGSLYHLAVEPAYQGRGLARRLVAECLAALRAAGVPRVFVMVMPDNPRGQAFWLDRGFEPIEAKPFGLTLSRSAE